MAGFASILGLLFQIVLIVFVARLIFACSGASAINVWVKR
jgi:hypothetical protein